MTNHSLTNTDLAQFTGTEHWYRHPLLKNIRYTDGVQFVAEKGGAYWLIYLIAFAQLEKAVKAEAFQMWILTVNADQSADLRCEDGNGNIVHTHEIEWTDFTLKEIKFYFADSVLLLTTEY